MYVPSVAEAAMANTITSFLEKIGARYPGA
jgi:hypothetical protein